jgi:hypothetical protein
MKQKLYLLVALLSGFTYAADPLLMQVNHLHIPDGYDANDRVEVVVTATLPTTCHHKKSTEIVKNGEKIEVLITTDFSWFADGGCHVFPVPFVETLNLGVLAAGQYTIVVNGSLSEKITIAQTSGPRQDDHIYAMIDHAEFDSPGKGTLVGKNYDDCLTFDHLELVSNERDTLAILPIMKRTSEFCSGKLTPLSIPFEFDLAAFSDEEVLVMVRTMNGNSVSTIVGP